jgi:cytochrome c oxidase subunit 2
MAKWEQLNFQNRYSPLIEQFIFLHDHIMAILVLIMFMVSYILLLFFISKSTIILQKENHTLEVIWTFLPGAVLILIAFPSLRLLYLSEESESQPIRIKTIGHQWYWSYEYRDFKNIEFDSFIVAPDNPNIFRLLDTDNSTAIPSKTPIQIFISSTDVLHAWTIPSLGVKADSTPGRLNIVNIISIKPGIYYGQCSEICGTNHSFMPIVLDVRPIKYFKSWIHALIYIWKLIASNFYFEVANQLLKW